MICEVLQLYKYIKEMFIRYLVHVRKGLENILKVLKIRAFTLKIWINIK